MSVVVMYVLAVHAEQAIRIVRGMSSVEVMEPAPALFQVETNLKSGRPPKWTLNGEVLEPSPTLDMDREGTIHSLRLISTDSSMCGPVLFTAGKSRSSAQLTVNGELHRRTLSMKVGQWEDVAKELHFAESFQQFYCHLHLLCDVMFLTEMPCFTQCCIT